MKSRGGMKGEKKKRKERKKKKNNSGRKQFVLEIECTANQI